MNNIFTGMLLVFLNFNIDIGPSRIGLIPTFLGYFFMTKGLSEMASFGERFIKTAPYAKGMIVYTGIIYAMDLFGISPNIDLPVNFVLGLISTIMSLIISYGIVMGIRDIETIKEQNLNSGQLYHVWKLQAIFSIIVYMCYIVPSLLLICAIVGFAIGAYYLSIFYKSKTMFYQWNPTE